MALLHMEIGDMLYCHVILKHATLLSKDIFSSNLSNLI